MVLLNCVVLAAAHEISLARLAVALLPVVLVLAIMWQWRAEAVNSCYAIARMLLQLSR